MSSLATNKLEKLFEHMEGEENFAFGVVRGSKNGEVSISYEFGREAEDSPMVGGASYGIGSTIGEALRDIYKDLRI